MPSLPRVLLLGRDESGEMRDVVAFVRERFGGGVRHVADVAEMLHAIPATGEWHPDLVVVLQGWPDEYSACDVQELLTRFPLARIVCCFGAWCETDGRTRNLWPLAARVPVTEALPRIEQEIAVIQGVASPLPLTASRGEMFEWGYGGADPSVKQRLRVCVVSPDRRWQSMLTQALERSGFACCVELHDVDCVLWDGDPWDDARKAQLLRRTEGATVPVVACFGYLRDSLIDEARQHGARGVLWKLSPLASQVEVVLKAAGRPVAEVRAHN